eukprot:13753183-Alexandrium_andersonii.AAC.1
MGLWLAFRRAHLLNCWHRIRSASSPACAQRSSASGTKAATKYRVRNVRMHSPSAALQSLAVRS